jgi:DNA polymerase
MGKSVETTTAAALVPARPALASLRDAARGCRACPLWERATQTVFGEGRAHVRVMMIGEQPGHEEDLAGRPFGGPAGQLLDRALARAGIDRRDVYVTNVVKHFKWEPKGKRRIHAKPSAAEIRASLPWLEAELAVVTPEVIVALGATAAQTLFGRSFRVTQERGLLLPSRFGPVVATVHPSAILRAPDETARHAAMESFVSDLAGVAAQLRRAAA